tara:strand:+ start:871 stop:1269 length:399 start_codon:yes stop_codon:yes gene_type:complete
MSEIRATTISNSAGTGPISLTGQSAAKAWVNFNGTGTVAIRDSENVSSLTDNNTGLYTVNYTTSLSNDDYAVSGTAMGTFEGTTASNGRPATVAPNLNQAYSTSATQLLIKDSADQRINSSTVCVTIHGDLA